MIFPELSMAMNEDGGGSGPAASPSCEEIGDVVWVKVLSKKTRRMGRSAKLQQVIIRSLI